MGDPFFTGVCTALVTPFLGGQVNYPMLQQLLRRQLETGVRSVVLSGTTGESATLTAEEKIRMIQIAKEYVGNQCTIIAGTGSNATAQAILFSQAAEKAGADAILVVSPYYNKATPDGLYIHYRTIAQAISIPMILYNVPSRTGVDIPVSVYKKLSGIPNIVGVKEASTDITKISRIIAACGPDFSVWAGNDDQILPVMASGGKGVISVASNIVPSKTVALCDAVMHGDLFTAGMLQRELLPLTDLLFCEVNPIPVKAAMQFIGYDCGHCRLPLTQLTKENQQKMIAFFS